MIRSRLSTMVSVAGLLTASCVDDSVRRAASTITVTTQATSEECPTGGVAFLTGEDGDGDGELTEDETSDRRVACNGQDAAQTLVEVIPIPLGDARCGLGGVEVRSGVDGNEDGDLQDDEVQSTEIVCTPTGQGIGVVEGDVVLSNGFELALFRGVKEVTGDLTVDCGSNATITSLAPLQDLEIVGGDLRIEDCPGLGTTDLPALREVGSLSFIGVGETFEPVGFNALTTVEGSLALRTARGGTPTKRIVGFKALTEVTAITITAFEVTTLDGFDALQEIPNTLSISGGEGDDDPLTEIDAFGALETLGWLRVSSLDNLEHLDNFTSITSLEELDLRRLPKLTSFDVAQVATNLQFFYLEDLPSLTSLEDLSALQTVGATSPYVNIYLNGLDGLTSLDDLTALTSIACNALTIRHNDNLQDLDDLVGLTTLDCSTYTIQDNPKLCLSVQTALEATAGKGISWTSNGTDPSCD